MANSTIGAKVAAWAKKKEKNVHEWMRWATRRMLRHAKIKAGVSYRLGNGPQGGQRFVSSPPGGYPGKREGDFMRSIRSDIKIDSKGFVEGKIYSTIGHAAFLEKGTGNMEPRPTMALTLQDLLPELRRAFPRMVRK